ncbi:GxxExxY protein, partial [Patescibacteria group bacterium]|nr:GxxExxY protein [Patescibacteria group bacterium]
EKIEFKRETPIEIADRKSNFADFIIENKILLELKTKNFIDKKDYYQTQRYLENANLQLGIIINFQQEHLKPKRVVNPKFINATRKMQMHTNDTKKEINDSHRDSHSSDFEAFECNSGHSHRDVIYNSGEESAQQIKLRFDRLGIKTENIKYLGETDTDMVCATIKKNRPALAIIDSIQTATSQDVDSSFGGVGQIKAATAKLMEVAKKDNIPIIIVGHITKGGDIAGPKLLEHMVDTVLYFEGEKMSHYRMLRAVKNRFGNTNEVGIFEMTGDGLKEVANPSAAFLENKSDVSGSVLTCTLGGNRPFLVEVQALTNPTQFGNPMRKSSGFDLNRLNIIATIINQRTDIKCASHDIILNIAGGIKIQDPAADLAVALAIISSMKNKVLPKNLVALGELGLGGELRKISQIEKRLNEAKRLGLTNILSPENSKTLSEAIKNLIF